MYIKETIIAGKTIEIHKYHSATYGRAPAPKPKTNISSGALRERNRRNAVKKLRGLLNANFKDGDWHCVFTYKKEVRPENAERAKKCYRQLMDRLKRAYNREGREFKYIAVTEYENTAIHHHIVLPYADTHLISSCWKFGMVRYTPLQTDGQYGKLAEYLVKETDKTMNLPGGIYRKRWNGSKNLIKPIIKKEVIDAAAFSKAIKPKKGYRIDYNQEYNEFYEDEFGYVRQDYIMIKLRR